MRALAVVVSMLAVAAAAGAAWYLLRPTPPPVAYVAVAPRPAPPPARVRPDDPGPPEADVGDRVVVLRPAVLRAGPAADVAVIGHLAPGDVVRRLTPVPVLGFFKVRQNGVEGWVWWPDVGPAPPPRDEPAPRADGAGRP